MIILEFLGMFLALIVICNLKNKWDEGHPKQCSFCGKMVEASKTLRDGRICYHCSEFPYRQRRMDIFFIMSDSQLRRTSVAELRNYMDEIRQRGEQMAYFRPTRVSPTGLIQADERLGLFIGNACLGNQYPHRIADIRSFKLVLEKDYKMETTIVEGGHISIKLNEPADELNLGIGVGDRFLGMRHAVKEAHEADLEFLEQLTGRRRG